MDEEKLLRLLGMLVDQISIIVRQNTTFLRALEDREQMLKEHYELANAHLRSLLSEKP